MEGAPPARKYDAELDDAARCHRDEDEDGAEETYPSTAVFGLDTHLPPISTAAEILMQGDHEPSPTSMDSSAATVSVDGSPSPPNESPPYWMTRHGRSISTVSYHSINQHLAPHTILLEDRSDDQHEASQGCWARSVTVDSYTIISDPKTIGAYVVWHCTVSTLKGGDMEIRKRYSEFDDLRANLVKSFPHAEAMIPKLPRKSVVSRFRPKFLEQRKVGLGEFLACVLLNPEFAASPVLKEFIFAT